MCLARVVTVLLAGWSSARGEDLPADDSTAPSALRERETRQARETVARLELSPAQARKLLPIADQAAALRVEHYEGEAARLSEVIDAFTAFAAEDARGQGFTPQVERRTARASHELKNARERLLRRLFELETDAAQYLSVEQRHRLASRGPGRGRAVGDGDRLSAARRELADLTRELHPAPGPMGRYVLHPAGGEALAQLAGVASPPNVRRALDVLAHGTEAYPRAEFERGQTEVRRLREEINNWNLINGLNFTAEQMEQIIALHDAARRRPATGPRQRAESVVELEQAVTGVLNEGQRQVLGTYKPCLIPPKNLKDPVRVGQANDRSHLERWLERARKTPPNRLSRLADTLLDKEAEQYGKLARAERQKRKSLLVLTARKAAALSDVDFALRHGALAQQIAPPDRRQALRLEIDALAAERGQPGVVARFVLKPAFIAQLQQRLDDTRAETNAGSAAGDPPDSTAAAQGS